MSEELTHVNSVGEANMVDVSSKDTSTRIATAQSVISMKKNTLDMILKNNTKKGDVLSVARIAGIMAAKKCSDLIPLCHPLMISKVSVDFEYEKGGNKILIKTMVKLNGQTGVEMEALIAATTAALTIYDMCKAVDRYMVISEIHIVEKSGGKSGSYNFKS